MRRIIMWQNVLTQGVERCVLAARDDGWELAGLALDVADGRSLEARYVVHVDARWHTRDVIAQSRQIRRGAYFSGSGPSLSVESPAYHDAD